MIVKNGILAMGFWALLLAPFLCGVGVLVHSCACEEFSECHQELQCPSDPCQVLALPSFAKSGKTENPADEADLVVPVILGEGLRDTSPAPAGPLFHPDFGLPGLVDRDRTLPFIC